MKYWMSNRYIKLKDPYVIYLGGFFPICLFVCFIIIIMYYYFKNLLL